MENSTIKFWQSIKQLLTIWLFYNTVNKSNKILPYAWIEIINGLNYDKNYFLNQNESLKMFQANKQNLNKIFEKINLYGNFHCVNNNMEWFGFFEYIFALILIRRES